MWIVDEVDAKEFIDSNFLMNSWVAFEEEALDDEPQDIIHISGSEAFSIVISNP